MDLKIGDAQPSDAERAAIDAVLGAPVGDPRARGVSGGYAARGRRDRLLPVLHAIQDRVGWISPGALAEISRRLSVPPAEVWGVATFYALFPVEHRAPVALHVCEDLACRLAGSGALRAVLATTADVACLTSPCLGQCERAPAVLVTRSGARPARAVVAPASADAVLEAMRRGESSLGGTTARGVRLLARVGAQDPLDLDAYRASGGYRGLAHALAGGADATLAEVAAAGLLGRGGAAFPTAKKWAAVAREAATPHYMVCNADESEPGTFKDRVLLEEDPFAVIEGMTIAAITTGCERGFVYLRGEYPEAEDRLQGALGLARQAGLLGDDVLGSGHRFDVEVRRGAGAYICGEETALFNSIEGRRAEPRSKPPFPAQVGLFGKPTVVQNVETLANVAWILREGAQAFRAVGTSESTGTRLFCVSGHVAAPGLYEVPMGTSLRELLSQAGGVTGGLQAILLGGAAGSFVGPDQLDLRLSFEGTRAAGATLGSGVVMVFDTTVDLRDVLGRIAAFFRDESCGQCVPCRIGTVRQEELLARLSAGAPLGSVQAERHLLSELGQVMRDASICGLGQTASSAVLSGLALLDARAAGGTP